MNHYDKIYIDGAWVASASTSTTTVVDSTTEEVIATVPAGAAGDAERAVAAARRAFGSWSATTLAVRAKYLAAIAEALTERSDDLVTLISAEVGTPRKIAAGFQVNGAIGSISTYLKEAEHYPWEAPGDGATIVRQPVGVVAAITAWNGPLGIALVRIPPALLAGCTVVMKPSEVAPLSAWVLAEACDKVGLPPGVFNLVSGDGPTVGEALVTNPEVDMISFTGSSRAGMRIGTLAAERNARYMLEMGGKSASIVLDDADLDQALKSSVTTCFHNSGQICTSPTRLLIDRRRYADAVEKIKAIAEQITVGDPATDVDMGPLVSSVQRDRVRSYIEKGIAEGARLVTGGPEAPEGLEKGFFVRPTVFADVTNSMTIAQEEVFGPVLCVIPYEDEDDAVRIANDSRYGLSGMVWSPNPDRAGRIARRLRTGAVLINGQPSGPAAPHGGFKHSGIGRTNGRFALDEYTEIQGITGEQ